MKLNQIAISCTTPDRLNEAKTLAAQLNLPFLGNPEDSAIEAYDFLLILTPHFLGLIKPPASRKRSHPREGDNLLLKYNQSLERNAFYIDFLSSKLLYRTKQAGLRKELLARAIGIKPSEHPRIIDATAGLGRDSYILATLGYEITMIEQSPILHALLQDGINRGREDKAAAPTLERLHLIHADSSQWLPTLSHAKRPDVIYLDPMFPERKKSASVKKDMAILQTLLGFDDNIETLFQAALTCAAKRVVVKRPRLATNIAALAPHFSVTGTTSRFDIYLV